MSPSSNATGTTEVEFTRSGSRSKSTSRKRILISILVAILVVPCVRYVSLAHIPDTAPPLCGNAEHHPVIMIPGIAASMIDIKIDIPDEYELPHRHCPRKWTEWRKAWISTGSILPEFRDCMVEYIAPRFKDGKWHLNPFSEFRIPYWGNTHPMSTLYPLFPINVYTRYFHPMVRYLKSEHGYVEGKDLFGAPYDWRMVPYLHGKDGFEGDFDDRFKKLVEDVYIKNDNRSVELISHSLGGTIMYKFLIERSQEWKDTYISNWVALSTPWIGSSDTMKAFISGLTFGVPFAPAQTSRDLERTFPACYYLLPTPYSGNIFNRTVTNEELQRFDGLPAPFMYGLTEKITSRKGWPERDISDPATLPPRLGRAQEGILPFVVSLNYTYTALDYSILFKTVGIEDPEDRAAFAYKSQRILSVSDENYAKESFAPFSEFPGVPVRLVYSTNRPTLTWMEYNTDDMSDLPRFHYGPGDGSAHEYSLRYAGDMWTKIHKDESVDVYEFAGIRHHRLMGHPRALNIIGESICSAYKE